jgi:hypothetical protein
MRALWSDGVANADNPTLHNNNLSVSFHGGQESLRGKKY